MKYKKSRSNSLADEEFFGATIHGHAVHPSQSDVVRVVSPVVTADEPLKRTVTQRVFEDRVCRGCPMHRFASLNRVFDFLKRHAHNNDSSL